jgi:hypothetical protein
MPGGSLKVGKGLQNLACTKIVPEEVMPMLCRTHMEMSPAEIEALEQQYHCKFSARVMEQMVSHWVETGVLLPRF